MTTLKVLFWASLFIVCYSYIGYGVLLYLLVGIRRLFGKKKFVPSPGFSPDVTIVISAFNEEEFIEKKIQNTFDLDYESDRLSIIIVTDGSTDATPDIVRRFNRIRLLHEPERRGKVAAMNRAKKFVQTDLIIFSDANTLLNRACVREIIKHYQDPRVGGVAGEKKIISGTDGSAAEAGEGLYWKYESFLKKMDAEFYSVVGAAGELFSARKSLFEEIPENVIIEDFVQSLKICTKGYRIMYEPNAYAMETSSASMKEEEKRKVRISAGAFQAMALLKELFNIFRYPVLSFQFISHRILRWTLCPLCLIMLFLSNGLIVLKGGNIIYMVFFGLQLAFYIMALTGRALANRNIRVKWLYVPYYFLFMNASVILGFFRFLRKKQTVTWEKAARRKLA
ncbi:MAG TPA: glycosyltransferase family 2 protein [Puia sp.]|nr:glycosyltransferase family 2 protein [Puia sp.]